MSVRLLKSAALSLVLLVPALAQAAPEGTIEKSASSGVQETVDAFLAVLEKQGATVFATVPHHKGAEKVGMEMKPATLVMFGNPKIGTPIMQLSPTMGLELPLRALFYEGEDGGTTILYPDLAAVANSHGIDGDDPAVQKAAKALNGLTGAVAK